MKIKKFLLVSIAVLISFAALSGFVVGVAMKFELLNIFLSLAPTAPLLPKTNILVLGLDRGSTHRSDTIMVLHVDPERKKAEVISIPRDTLIILPGRGLDKINHAFAYGGIPLARKTVEDFLHIPVPHHITVDLKGIEKLVDDLGGVEIEVEKRMYYVDFAGDLKIDLQAGRQKLNGEQALGYLRFRHTDNDFARIGRQQKFLQSIASQLMTKDNMLRSPAAFLSLLGCVESDLNSREILSLSLSLRGATENGRINMSLIPGTDLMVDGIYYFRPDEAGTQKMVEQFHLDNHLALTN